MDVNQDQIWDHYQNEAPHSFSGSDARISYLVNQIPKGARCLNIGVGNGNFEKFAYQKGIDIHSLDPSTRSIENLQTLIEEKAKVGYSQAIPIHIDYHNPIKRNHPAQSLNYFRHKDYSVLWRCFCQRKKWFRNFYL